MNLSGVNLSNPYKVSFGARLFRNASGGKNAKPYSIQEQAEMTVTSRNDADELGKEQAAAARLTRRDFEDRINAREAQGSGQRDTRSEVSRADQNPRSKAEAKLQTEQIKRQREILSNERQGYLTPNEQEELNEIHRNPARGVHTFRNERNADGALRPTRIERTL